MSRDAILLLAHGSPDRIEEIPEFLRNVTGGRPVPEAVIEEVKHRYGLIGRSPLTEITLRQGAKLAERLGLPVYVGMRNWKPYISDAVEEMNRAGVERAVAICLAPQNSRTSVGLYRKALFGEPAPRFAVDFVEEWHEHGGLVRAFAERLQARLPQAREQAGGAVAVLFTAHSVPERTIQEGDPYERQAKETASLVAQAAGLGAEEWVFAFQSQGMSGGAWLGPTVEDTILNLKERRYGGVFVQPIGFLCDHVEVLYDVDIAFREFAAQHDMRLWRAESLNDSPLLIAALAELARARLAAFSAQPA